MFCLAIHPLVSQLESEFCVWYLDDGTIGGPSELLSEDLQSVVHEGAALGLFLNERKCEVICIDTGLISGPPSVTSLIPGAQLIQSGCATLLGSSIGDTASISDILSSKTQILHDMGERLHYFSSQDAFLLLKNYFSIPKVLHLLRSAPTFLSAGLIAYDKEQRSILPMFSLTTEHGLKLLFPLKMEAWVSGVLLTLLPLLTFPPLLLPGTWCFKSSLCG